MMETWPKMILEALTQHIPQSAAWLPYASTGVLALLGLVLMAKGAKLAPLMAACAFATGGGLSGSYVAHWFSTPVWPTIGVGAAIGFGLGLVLFKLWLSILVAASFVVAALSFYGVKVVSPHLEGYTSQGYNAREPGIGVTLPMPGSTVAVAPSPQEELTHLWSYLTGRIPSFQTSFWAIVASTGLAGLLVGLLVPRVARALLASTLGLGCVLLAVVAGLKALWPEALGWLTTLGPWTWGVAAGVWTVSLLYNFVDLGGRRTVRRDPPEPVAKPAAA